MTGQNFRQALFSEAARAAAIAMPPPVRRVFMPEPNPDPAREPEFGVVQLADGSAGLYYAWLGEGQRGMAQRFPPATLAGLPALELARYFLREDEASRSLGLAAINAMTAWWWRHHGYSPPVAQDAFGAHIAPTDRVGMVGNFQPLIEHLLADRRPVVVLERKPHLWREAPGLRVTGDPSALSDCTVVLATATMCLNDSLEATLAFCREARAIAIIGPTAGFFPGPLFARGVSSMGGMWLEDADAAIVALTTGKPWKPYARRFVIERADYPDFARRAGA
jgi:uncharacterized protein (DUF4213/DUF364 family)